MEKGFLFLRSTLLDTPVKSDTKLFPVRSCSCFLRSLRLFLVNYVAQQDNICKYSLISCSFLQTSDWTEIQIIILSKGEITVLFARDKVIGAKFSWRSSDYKEFYIGGIPQDLRERYVLLNFPLDQ